eukprot:13027.XXX_519129_522590_1 [CDS] Oithona nana genome sequencing.
MEDNASSDKMRLSCESAAVTEVNEVISVLGVHPDKGLSSLDASRRRNFHGFNEVTGNEAEPIWKKYLDQFNNPFILLLLASALISILMKQFDDAVSITVAIVIVVTVGFVQEYRSEKTLERMGALLPPTCRVLREGHVNHILARYLVPGDVVSLEIGDRVPADVRLIKVNELSVDESSFTGEPVSKDKIVSSVKSHGHQKLHISDMSNVAFQGTLVTNGNGQGIVISTGENSQFGELFRMMREEETPRTPLQKSMDTLGKQLSIYSIGVIFMIMAIGCWQGREVMVMFNVGVSLAVAAIPEGLPIVVTVTLAFGVMRMAKRQAIVKRLPTVEALGCVDFICSDKTGTLTTNDMTVYCDRTSHDILKDVVAPLIDTNDKKKDNSVDALMEVAVLCNNAFIEDGGRVCGSSSTERALLKHAVKLGYANISHQFERLTEVPFSSDRKFMSVQCRSKLNSNVSQYIKGAIEEILPKCSQFAANGSKHHFDDKHRLTVEHANESMASRGLRVLALARGRTLVDLEFVGLFGLHDPPRPGVDESIKLLQNSNVRVCMITGDGKETASAISHALAIQTDGKVLLSGAEVDAMSDVELQRLADKVCCYYRANPLHKRRIVTALKSNGHVVGMTGDGVNDGVAVKSADVGISMGKSGTDVCKEAADMILLDDNFSTILSAIEEGKCIFYNIRNFVRFQLSTSIAALMLISISTILDRPNPLNPMQILWINIIMDGPPAQSLGLEPVDPDVIKKPPRKISEPILTRSLLENILLSAFIIICGTLWVYKMTMEDDHMTARETTMTFTCFVFFDMFNALSSRSQDKLISEIGFFSNKVFCVAVALSLLGQLAVIYFPPLQYIFQTEALAFEDLVLLACLSSSVFIICEAKKLLQRY